MALGAVLRSHPKLGRCLVRCRHCGIRFFTHPCNAGRRDLHCEFGCREYRHRQQANERSKKHYQTDRGRWNKKLLNAKRSAAACDEEASQAQDAVVSDITPAVLQDTSCANTAATPEAGSRPDPAHQLTQVGLEKAPQVDATLMLDGFTLDEAILASSPMLPYLAMVATVIEGRTISADELLGLLLRTMRQRSLSTRPESEYVLDYLNRHPP
jgi:hypothetical protein